MPMCSSRARIRELLACGVRSWNTKTLRTEGPDYRWHMVCTRFSNLTIARRDHDEIRSASKTLRWRSSWRLFSNVMLPSVST